MSTPTHTCTLCCSNNNNKAPEINDEYACVSEQTSLRLLLERWQYFCWEYRGHLPTARKWCRQHGMSQQQQQRLHNSSLLRADTSDFRWEWCDCDGVAVRSLAPFIPAAAQPTDVCPPPPHPAVKGLLKRHTCYPTDAYFISNQTGR